MKIGRTILVFSLLFLLTVVFLKTISFGNNIPSERQAIKLAQKSTPLIHIIETYVPGPPFRAIHGKDKDDKELVVFVDFHKEVKGFVYLQDGIPKEKAIEAVRKSLNFEGQPDSVRFTWDGSKPFWSIQKGLGADVILYSVDFYTGSVIHQQGSR